MTEPDLVGLFVEPLERSGLTYMVTGGVASVVYGDPRFTRDVDVVVAVDPARVEHLLPPRPPPPPGRGHLHRHLIG